MDPKAEGRLNRLIIKISAVLFLLLGIGVLVVEYIFWVEHHLSNITALIIFITSIVLYSVITFVVLKNRKRIFSLGEDDQFN
jgi:predicted ABC-type exoprotein transport system permease subunit